MEKKFIESSIVDDWEVLTPDGFVPIKSSHKTIEYVEYVVKTESYELYCADHHILFKSHNRAITAENLKVGDYILTEKGLDKVIHVQPTGQTKNMFDLQVDSFEQSYYTNGILSHNTATAALYLLWYAMFNSDKNILVTSYKWDAVNEVMDRIRYAYEELPDWLRPGATTYSTKKIVFDNDSSITAQTIGENTGRGLSISLLYCLDGGTTVTVKDIETDEVKDITLESLYTELEGYQLEGMSSKPRLRIQFTDMTFIDVDEDISLHINGIKTTIENIEKGDLILLGNEELAVDDIYMLDADGVAIL